MEKVWECRAVIVGNEVFAVAIHAGSEAARIDWRSDYAALSYEVIDLPPGPQWHEFGLTATRTRHTVWFGSPDGPSWPLPVPDDTAEPTPDRTALAP